MLSQLAMRKTFLIFHLAFACFAYEFELRNSPHVFIAGDVVGIIGEEGYSPVLDAPAPYDIVADELNQVRFELSYQNDRQRSIAFSGKESFLVNLRLSIGVLEYHVGRIRVPAGDSSDFVIHLKIFLSSMTTSTPDHDLEDQVRQMYHFVKGKRMLAFDRESQIIIDDSLTRIPKFSQGALTPESQLFRDVWATHMFNSMEWMTTCARAVIFPISQKIKSQIPREGDPASNN